MRTYVVHNQLAAIGPIKSHMLRKIAAVDKAVMVTTSCSDSFEYPRILGTDADSKIFHLTKGSIDIRIVDPKVINPTNKCKRCGWPGEAYKKIVRVSVEVVCMEGSELERFVQLFEHRLLATAGQFHFLP